MTSTEKTGSGHPWPLCMCPQEDTWSFLIQVFLKPQEDPERGRSFVKGVPVRGIDRQTETGSSFDSNLNLCGEHPSPPSRAAQALWEACRALSDHISWSILQTNKVSRGGAELQAKCLGCQGGQGKFQPTLFCLQAQTFHYTTHSAKFKHLRV